MVESYLNALERLLQQTAVGQNDAVKIDTRHFFSGAAAYADERIFMSLTPAGLALKLSADDCALLLSQGATPLKYFPKAPVKKDYVVLPDRIAENKASLNGWIGKSAAYVLTLPKPKPKSGGR